MTEPTTIHCADCDREAQAHKANMKYCAVCRLFRNLVYLENRTTDCVSCSEKFAPFRRGDVLCADCDVVRPRAYTEGTCALCAGGTYPLLHADVAVCLRCAKDPAQRRTFLQAVAKKRNAQRAVVA